MSEGLTKEDYDFLLSGFDEQEALSLEIVKWEGKIHCVYLNDKRIAGGKPWGGGNTARSFSVKKKDLIEAIRGPEPRPNELDEAVKIARLALELEHDPDSHVSILSRQLLRTLGLI